MNNRGLLQKNIIIIVAVGLIIILTALILGNLYFNQIIFGQEVPSPPATTQSIDQSERILSGENGISSQTQVLDNKQYLLPNSDESWLGSEKNRWNAAFDYANFVNLRVSNLLKIGDRTVNIATDTIAFSSTTPKIIFGGGITNAALSFVDDFGNVLATLTDAVDFPIFRLVSGRLDVSRDFIVDSDNSRGFTLNRYSADVGEAPFISFRRNRGSQGSELAVAVGDYLGNFDFEGYDGSTTQLSARFAALVDGLVTSGSVPTAFSFFTGSNSSTLAERMRITSGGLVGLGTTSPNQRLDINGKIKIGTDAATPTAGTLRWTGTAFEGFDGVQWLSIGGSKFSGTVFSNEGVTPLSGGITIRLAINGVDNTSADSNTVTGAYSLVPTITVSAGDVLTFYIEDELPDAVTVTVSDGGSISGIDLYQNRLITRHDNGGSLTNSNLATAAVSGETDISSIYSVSAGALMVVGGKELFILPSHTFAPGAAVTVEDIDINGTFTMAANAVTVSGTWDAAGGSFTSSGTVTLNATSPELIFSGGNSFNNIIFDGPFSTLEDSLDVNGNLSILTGKILDTNSLENNPINVAGNWSNTGSFIPRLGTVTFDGSALQTLTGETFYNLTINNSVASPGDSTDVDSSALVTVTNSLIVTDGQFQPTTNSDFNNVSIGAAGILKPDASATIKVSGNWTNSGTFTANTGTVTFDGTSQTLAGATTFNNFTKIEGLNNATDEILIFTANSTTTIADTWTLDGRDADDHINLVSSSSGTQWKVNPQGTRTLDFIDVTDSNNINATAINCTTVGCSDAVNGGNNTNWTFAAVPPVSGSSLTTSGVSTNTLTITSVPSGSNRLYLVGVSLYGPGGMVPSVVSMTGGGLTWSLLKRQCNHDLGYSFIEVWQAFGSPSSSFNLTISLTTGTASAVERSSAALTPYSGAQAVSPANVIGSNPNGQGGAATCASGGGSTSSPAALTISTTSPSSDIYFTATATRQRTITGVTAGFIQKAFVSNNSGGSAANIYIHEDPAPSTSPKTINYTLSSATKWEMVGLVIKPAP